MTNTFFRQLSAALIPIATVAAILPAIVRAQENPIDCEILICMAAGFPGASGCGPAYSEMIDRVRPWPVEPPLQIWNCPMNIPQQYGNYEIDLASPEYAFATSFRVFNFTVRDRQNDAGECNRDTNISIGTYDSTGTFSWNGGSRVDLPAEVGIRTTGCNQRHRAIFIEWEDEQGTNSSQRINY